MPRIPDSINGVSIEFADRVNRDALQMLVEGLVHTVIPEVAAGHVLATLWVSSVRDQHACPSRHVTGNAADLSRINGKKIGTHYATDPEVRAIVDALQQRFESYQPHRRENFGPSIKLKLGRPFDPGGHQDHIHFSVSGPHDCPRRVVQRGLHVYRASPPREEVCDDAIEQDD